jgi:hypothetical protein
VIRNELFPLQLCRLQFGREELARVGVPLARQSAKPIFVEGLNSETHGYGMTAVGAKRPLVRRPIAAQGCFRNQYLDFKTRNDCVPMPLPTRLMRTRRDCADNNDHRSAVNRWFNSIGLGASLEGSQAV